MSVPGVAPWFWIGVCAADKNEPTGEREREREREREKLRISVSFRL